MVLFLLIKVGRLPRARELDNYFGYALIEITQKFRFCRVDKFI